jgi:DNA-binding CsgD family transcriptional regulator
MPFVEAIRGYLINREASLLSELCGQGASHIARIMPELRDQIQVEAANPGDPEYDRWRLQQAVVDFFANASLTAPILLTLEDVHDADAATLELLRRVASSAQTSRLLVMISYRDVEVSPQHPLSATLAALHREVQQRRFVLQGLSVDEVRQMCSSIWGDEVSRRYARAVHTRTEGNPLFVQEVLRYLVDGTPNDVTTGPSAAVKLVEASFPDGLREVVSVRLGRLSPVAREVLAAAAVAGVVRHDVLQMICPMEDGQQLHEALHEAVRAGVLQERAEPGTIEYRFAHSLFRQALYEELSAVHRSRLHVLVANAVEALHAHHLEDHAAELAGHLAFALDREGVTRGITYLRTAARQALEMYAFAEAAHLFDQALSLHLAMGVLDLADHCELLLELGAALIPAGQPQRVADDVAVQAFAFAEQQGDASLASRAAQLALEAFRRYGGPPLERSPLFLQWANRAWQYAAPESTEQVYAGHALASHAAFNGSPGEAGVLLDRALDLARRLGDSEALLRSAWQLVMLAQAPSQQARVLQVAEEFSVYPREGVTQRTLGSFLHWTLVAYLRNGNRAMVDRLKSEIIALAEGSHDAALAWRPLELNMIEHSLNGDLELAREAGDELVRWADQSGMGVFGRAHAYSWTTRSRWYLGELQSDEADAYLASHGEPLALGPLRVQRGQHAEAHAALRDAEKRGLCTGACEPSLHEAAVCLETALLLQEPNVIQPLVEQLLPVAGLVVDYYALTSVARLLGKAAKLAGDALAARGYFEQGLAVCTQLQFRPELALIRLELAELLLDDPDAVTRSEGSSQLQAAISELRAMHMRPSLERALGLRTETLLAIDVLSRREREIAALLARGMSNRAIAERLVISETTVEVHVKHILNKLHFKSRTRVATWFARYEQLAQECADPGIVY